MVVLDGGVFSTSAEVHNTSNNIMSHKRYPSMPSIKNFENRGNLLGASDSDEMNHNIMMPAYKLESNTYQYNADDLEEQGMAASIVSTMVSRQHSKIKKKKRFMFSAKEIKKHFFYPVGAPKKSKSIRKKARYRTHGELDAIMRYVRIDPGMTKDLCLNQKVRTFEVPEGFELYKPRPKLMEKLKSITIDSNNNYILYTPNPTISKNSFIAADKFFEQELHNLTTSTEKSHPDNVHIINHRDLPLHRYSTLSSLPSHDDEVLRTFSLPTSIESEAKIRALWALYLRRVIAERIKWRLKNSSASTVATTLLLSKSKLRRKYRSKETMRSADTESTSSTISTSMLLAKESLSDQHTTPNIRSSTGSDELKSNTKNVSIQSHPVYGSEVDESIVTTNDSELLSSDSPKKELFAKNQNKSLASTVDTNFFLKNSLEQDYEFPKSSPSKEEPDNKSIDSDDFHSASSQSGGASSTRAVMFDSLEQLIQEVSSVLSGLDN